MGSGFILQNVEIINCGIVGIVPTLSVVTPPLTLCVGSLDA